MIFVEKERNSIHKMEGFSDKKGDLTREWIDIFSKFSSPLSQIFSIKFPKKTKAISEEEKKSLPQEILDGEKQLKRMEETMKILTMKTEKFLIDEIVSMKMGDRIDLKFMFGLELAKLEKVKCFELLHLFSSSKIGERNEIYKDIENFVEESEEKLKTLCSVYKKLPRIITEDIEEIIRDSDSKNKFPLLLKITGIEG